MNLSTELQNVGIKLRSFKLGHHKVVCPQCSHARRKKNDPCLSVTISDDDCVFYCHHCNWTGNIKEESLPVTTANFVVKSKFDTGISEILEGMNGKQNKVIKEALPAKILSWFERRKISVETLDKNKIGAGKVTFGGIKQDAICFPYYRNGKLISTKYRATRKRYTQTRNGEKIFYGLDDLNGGDLIIVEGEVDKLSCNEAGIGGVVSVPNGAPSQVGRWPKKQQDDKAFDYLWNCRQLLDSKQKIILATDTDGPGQVLAEELARRIGREKCWRVHWPDGCKDANDVLVKHGKDKLKECIASAQPYPIKSLYCLDKFLSETLSLFHGNVKKAISTGWSKLDPYMKIREGEVTVLGGLPGVGKSEFIDALMINLAKRNNWSFVVCSFENPPDEHIAKLSEKQVGMPFWDGPTMRMSEASLQESIKWLNKHIYLIRAEDETPTIDWILEAARGAVLRYGVRGLVIDPYNEIAHHRPDNMTETEYVGQLLGKLRRFAQVHGCHVWIVVHPAKMRREDGLTPTPTLYDSHGSANWANKCDIGVIIHRSWDDKNSNKVEIRVGKVRHKAAGQPGTVTLDYNRVTGEYT